MWLRSQEKYKTLMDQMARQCQLSEFTKALDSVCGINQEFSTSRVVKKKKELMGLANNEQAKKELKEELVQEKEKLNEQKIKLGIAGILPSILFSGLACGIAFIVQISFKDQVFAKLPFVPISIIRFASHFEMPGDDPTDCSFLFLFLLCFPVVGEVSTFRPIFWFQFEAFQSKFLIYHQNMSLS